MIGRGAPVAVMTMSAVPSAADHLAPRHRAAVDLFGQRLRMRARSGW